MCAVKRPIPLEERLACPNSERYTAGFPMSSDESASLPPAAPSEPSHAPTWLGLNRTAVAAIVFVVLLGAYSANGDFLYMGDADSNSYVPVSVLTDGDVAFAPSEMPFMFLWLEGGYRVRIPELAAKIEQLGFDNLRDPILTGALKVKPLYYIIPSTRTTSDGEPLFVSTFGPGAGLSALPLYALASLQTDLRYDASAVNWVAKYHAALVVAASGVLIFLTAAHFVPLGAALALALAYGLGTCVWTLSSQTLWQHGPSEFFLALATYFFLTRKDPSGALLAGLAIAAATACRPTNGAVAIAFGLGILLRTPRRVPAYVIGGTLIAIPVFLYNHHYLGSFLNFGQTEAGDGLALEKTGVANMWQGSLWEGLIGLMFSPSRGLLVFSPWMIASFVGAVLAFRREAYRDLIAVVASVACLFAIAFRWYDWWGGHGYGYRPIIDTVPLLAVLAIPTMTVLSRRLVLGAGWGLLVAWSIFVQAIGAFAYNVYGWNARLGVEVSARLSSKAALAPPAYFLDVDEAYEHAHAIADEHNIDVQLRSVRMNIDEPQFRDRLWSFSDNQIRYYIENFTAARQRKHDIMHNWITHRVLEGPAQPPRLATQPVAAVPRPAKPIA